jgi:transposase InsO family protein
MTDGTRHARWARFRFSVIGPLLAAPPEHGELRAALDALAQKTWKHPITGEPVRFGRSTLERWLYTARNAPRDPVTKLRRKLRRDAGQQPSLSQGLREVLRAQHRAHPRWSATLHADNLAVVAAEHPELGAVPSTSTVRRYLRAQGLVRERTKRGGRGVAPPREVRSYEAEYVLGLWHADFHHGSRRVLEPSGRWQTPILLGVLDDASRIAAHLQWYLDETAESFVHGLSQGFQKWGLPRSLLTDNGPAMLAQETRAGLERLGIVHETTLPYSPHQNAKQEVFWAQVEGRLLAMLEGVSELTLTLLNEATHAWLEGEYHRTLHRELGCSPLERFRKAADVGRESPDAQALRRAFRAEVVRTPRRSDGTLSLEGRRFELPTRYRALRRVHVRYARWDLRSADLVDPHTGATLAVLHPLDKRRNAERGRSALGPLASLDRDETPARPADPGMAPLLRKLLADYAATGRPPAYLPLAASREEPSDE